METDKSMHCIKTAPKKTLLVIILILFLIIFITVTRSDSSRNTNVEKKDNFQTLALERFVEIKTAIPELENIVCEGGDCKYVVNFYFKEKPEDLETIIRGNTATYSKFKQDTVGSSQVSIVAYYNNKAIFKCNGSSGTVEGCSRY